MHRRFYANLSRPQSPSRRTSITGTEEEIDNLRRQHRDLTGKWSYHKRIKDLEREHLVQDIHKAEQAFEQQDFTTCQDKCLSLLAQDPISDAISAKAYMLLARPEVMPDSPHEREHYARLAVNFWGVVIERKGYCHTRFPVAKAREQRQIARGLLENAQREATDSLADEVVHPRGDSEDKNATLEADVPAAQESQEL